ncbi:MAG: right-handed parallel beta-helix repeat-containing protein [bacterium]|nr:right-handed parallel beta-helix repeat-containing protein [bacterium]
MERLFYTLNNSIIRTIFAVFLCTSSAFSATFTVTNLNDAGAGSFRQAIINSNGSAGSDVIVFSVSGTISMLSILPPLTDVVDIDGTTAPGYSACGVPVVAIDGSSAGASNGIQVLAGASGSTIQALNVRNYALNGVQFIDADNCQLRACFIGTNSTGTAAAANGLNGVQVEGAADNNLIGGSALCDGNLISGNGGFGISINGSVGTTIQGNVIGLNTTGVASLANTTGGILAVSAADGTIIGGSLASEANIVSGNGSGLTGNGINLDGSSGCFIRGNYVGLDVNGTSGIGNAENGISLNGCPNTTIGGTGANEMNVISDHNFHAIVLNNSSDICSIIGNNIGTNAAGTATIGNDDSGVIVINSSGTIIGGTSAAAGNVLSGSLSEYGIFAISSSGLEIYGNYVGTDRTGVLNLANADGGIRFDFGAGASAIGGAGAGEPNIIAFNNGYGVGVLDAGSNQVLISRNSFYCNTGKGIELNGVGNSNIASPVITSATTSSVSGTAGNNQTIELYYDSTCTATCQGKDFIGIATTSGPGNWTYNGPITNSPITAIAISNLNDNTSEFATCFTAITGLPVEFGDFSGRYTHQGNLLKWSTISEKDAAYFALERSADGIEWNEVGWVQATGNTTNSVSYAYLDQNPFLGMQYYRLLQFDLDGTQDQHKTIVTINTLETSKSTLVGVYNMLGQEIQSSTKGVQIHVFSDGTTKKVIAE